MRVNVKTLRTSVISASIISLLFAGCSYLIGATPMSQELHKISGAIDHREVERTF
jgi:glycerol-3-phosphate acyltransferase PlsY